MEVIKTIKPLPQRAPGTGKRARRTINRMLRQQGMIPAIPNAVGNVLTTYNPQVVKLVPSAQTVRNRKRRARKKQINNNLVQYSPAANSLNNPLMPQPLGVATGKNNMVKSRVRASINNITPEGLRFLKCAFSAADFDGSGTYGVPDDFSGKSLAVKHRLVQPDVARPNVDTYILVLPIPGYAYFIAVVPAGTPVLYTTAWMGVPYSDYSSLFPGTMTSTNVEKFRFVSQHVEIVPTVNSTSWTGSIQTWKIPVQVTTAGRYGGDSGYQQLFVNGLMGTNATNADMYTGPFNLGTYVGAFNKGSVSWDFSTMFRDVSRIPSGTLDPASDFGEIAWEGTKLLPGFDNNMESICVKFSGIGANTNDSYIIKTWACVEYQFTPGSVMYESQNLHYEPDEEAMRIYRYVAMNLPVGVSFLDNANFWNRVLSIIKQMSGALSMIPGPYGVIAGGVNAVATGIETLTI